jgi:hypothetical protein
VSIEEAIRHLIPAWDVINLASNYAETRSTLVSRHTGVGADGVHYGTTSHGITETTETTTTAWTRVAAIDPDALAALRAANQARQEHAHTWVPFQASREATGCGPIPRVGPVTRAQSLYDGQHERWYREVAEPYYLRAGHLDAITRAAYRQALVAYRQALVALGVEQLDMFAGVA